MSKNEKISILIGVILSITGAFSTYFIYNINGQLSQQQGEIAGIRAIVLEQGKDNKRDYEYILKNYMTQANHDKDVTRLDKSIDNISMNRIRR